MYLGSTAVCCDEAMKLVTCLLILTFGYFCRKGGSDGGGEYSQLSSSESNNVKDFDNEDSESDVENPQNNADILETENQGGKTFGGYLRQELQFDWRMGGLALLYTIQKNLLYLAISNLDAAVFQVTYQAKILTTALDKVEENASKSFQEQKRWVGVLAVLGACCTSGFGGVYFELVLKPRQDIQLEGEATPRPPPSVWAKNVQLSSFALVIALITAFVKDHAAILQNGFFQGYSPLVVLVITLEAGLFVGGSLLVFIAIYMYSMSDESAAAAASSRPEQLPAQTSEIAMMAMGNEKRKSSGFSSGLSSTSEDVELEDIELEMEDKD
ncbi:hypothetical protein HJC23_006832 [Cyclotella cryptica]|uniref:Uncharacterized protein n=1 Tax=Cyclotella cryptica TaxID=29204 RepID=A0ABD3PH72_9STRA